MPQLALALGLAHLLNYRLRGRTFLRVAMLMPYATSVAAATLVFALIFGRDAGLVNGLLGVVGIDPVDWRNGDWTAQIAISVIVIWRWTGYNALIYLAGMQSISHDLYEAAALDGANRWQQFLHVTLPGLRPTILFTVVVSTIGASQLFGEPLLFGGGQANGGPANQYQTLGLFMYQQGWQFGQLGRAATVAWVMFVMIVGLVLLNTAGSLAGGPSDDRDLRRAPHRPPGRPHLRRPRRRPRLRVPRALLLHARRRQPADGRDERLAAAAAARRRPVDERRDGDPSSRTSAWRWSTRCSSPATITAGDRAVLHARRLRLRQAAFRGRNVAVRDHDRHDDDPAEPVASSRCTRSWPTWGWPGPLPSVILPSLVTAFGVFFMRQYLMQSLPDELIEAARMDGATSLRTVWSIVLPIARPGMAVLGMLTFMTAWNDFFWPVIALTSTNPTVQVALNNLGSGYVPDQP